MEAPAGFVSFLADLPKRLTLGSSPVIHPFDVPVFDEKGLLKWELFTKAELWTGQSGNPRKEHDGFLWASNHIFKYADSINKYWNQLNRDEFSTFFDDVLPYLFPEVETAYKLLDEIKSNLQRKQNTSLKVLAIITATFERFLHTFASYLQPSTASSESKKLNGENEQEGEEETIDMVKPPSYTSLKMKDILQLPSLKNLIGADRTYMLRLLVGPLHGINVRNLVWHGFLSPHECPQHYQGLLFGIMLSLASEWKPLIQAPSFMQLAALMRCELDFWDPYLLLSTKVLRKYYSECIDPTSVTSLNASNDVHIMTTPSSPSSSSSHSLSSSLLLKNFKKGNLELLRQQLELQINDLNLLLDHSPFVLNGFKHEWQLVFKAIMEKEHYDALVTMTPLFEAALRRFYVEANGIESFRLTAEPDTLCLSLDIILEAWLDREFIIQEARSKRRQNAVSHSSSVSNPLLNGAHNVIENPTQYHPHHHPHHSYLVETSSAPPTLAEVTSNLNALRSPTPELEDGDDDNDLDLAEVGDDGKFENKIFKRIGARHCNPVFDILIWTNTLGLGKFYRPRDQLAHGCVIPSTVSDVNVWHTFLLLLSLMQCEFPQEIYAKFSVPPTSEHSLLRLSSEFVDTYQPVFHRKAATIFKLQELREYSEKWQQQCYEMYQTPNVAAALDAINKEKKSSQTAHEDVSRAKINDFKLLKERVKNHIRDAHSKRPTCPADLTGMDFPIVTPISIKSLSQSFHVAITIGTLKRMLDLFLEKYVTLCDKVEKREAWVKSRRQFASLTVTYPLYAICSDIVTYIFEEMLYHDGYATTAEIYRSENKVNFDFPTYIYSVIQRIRAYIEDGRYKMAEDVMFAFLSSTPIGSTVLAKLESYRMWMDIEGYLTRVTRYKNGEPLEASFVFEVRENLAIRQALRLQHGSKKAPKLDDPTMVDFSAYTLFLLRHNLGHAICTNE